LSMQCPQCGQALPQEARFCLTCGVPLAGTPAYAARGRERIPGWAIALMVGCGGVILFLMVTALIIYVYWYTTSPVGIPPAHGRYRADEAEARAALEDLRYAVKEFEGDTGTYPRSLRDLSARTAPESGLVWNGTAAAARPISRLRWRGPYLEALGDRELPVNRLTGGSKEGVDWIYETSGLRLGSVSIGGVTGNDSAGEPYSEW